MVAMLASAAAMSSPALAVGTPQYGSVKLQWNVAVALTATIHTDYTSAAALANSGAAPTYGENGTGGACSNTSASTTDLIVDFGTITPSLTNTVACNYQNALGVAFSDNDSTGVKGYEYLDANLPTGMNLCAFGNTGALPITTPTATATGSTHTGASIPVAYSGGACAAGGVEVKNGAGTVNNAGAGPVGTLAAAPTGEYMSGSTLGNWISTAGASASTVDATEDLQLNVGSSASSGAANVIMTVELIPN